MIYEMRTYTLRPRTLPEVLKRFGEAYEKRKRFSPLFAFWYTEIGPLNQIVHIWAFPSMDERSRRRKAMAEDPGWRTYLERGAQFLQVMENSFLLPAPFWQPAA